MEQTKKLTQSLPLTTLPTTTQSETTATSQQITTTNSKTTVYKTTTINTYPPSTTSEQTTAKLIIFERTTTPLPATEESPIPEAESDSPDHEVHWITATPASGPKIVTEIIDLEPVQETTPESIAQQQDNTAATADLPPITIFHKESTTIQPIEEQTITNAEETLRTETSPEITTQQQEASTYPPTTQQVTQQQTTQQAFVTDENTQLAEDQSTATPILILTQEQTNMPTTQSGTQTTGVTAELIVPHHAVDADSSETHPRTWKPRKDNRTLTTLHKSEGENKFIIVILGNF